jgi:hypothetical protein
MLVVGLCSLLAVVSAVMCTGLLGDEPSERRSRDDTASEEETSDVDELPEEHETEPIEDAVVEDEAVEDEIEAAPEGVRLLTGTVFGNDGPLEDAEVVIDGHPRLRDVTNSRGDYRLSGVPAAALTLIVSAPGYADEETTIDAGADGDELRTDVTVDPGDSVAGVVVDGDGKAVSGAEVACTDKKRKALTTRTDQRGRFELPTEADGCEAVATHSVYGESPRLALLSGPDNPIALVPPASIAGVVVDDKGAPLRSFRLSIAEYRAADGSANRGRTNYQQTFSHPQGRFSIRALPPGSYVLSASHTRYPDKRTKTIKLARGQQLRDVRIVMTPP